jgi:hypothetical protein
MATEHEDPDDLLDEEAAAEVLGVAVGQLHAMADQGLLTPEGSGGAARFRRAELLAARELGG